jgi:phosphoribosylanthranilate isomerase
MPLKTVVKVGNISNLSDARYCAGMGVDMLGFRVLEDQENYISAKLFQEIRGWVSGPKVIAEIYGIVSHQQLATIIADYAPDYFELTLAEYKKLHSSLTLPALISITTKEAQEIEVPTENIAYFIVPGDEETDLNAVPLAAPVLLKINSTLKLQEKITHPSIGGVALSGTPEIRPGYKDFDELADILELLDEV